MSQPPNTAQEPKTHSGLREASGCCCVFVWRGSAIFWPLGIMRAPLLTLSLLSAVGCSTTLHSKATYELLPPEPKASASFRGITQAGEEEHRFEVRRVTYYDPMWHHRVISEYQYVVYVAGPTYGPEILEKIEGAGILVKKTADNIVEIYYTAGAHTDMRERWQLLGDTAKLQEKKEIEWNQRPQE